MDIMLHHINLKFTLVGVSKDPATVDLSNEFAILRMLLKSGLRSYSVLDYNKDGVVSGRERKVIEENAVVYVLERMTRLVSTADGDGKQV